MKKNVLFIVHCIPYPLTSGGRQAIYNGINAVKDDVNVVVTYQTENAQETVVADLCKSLEGKATVRPYVIPKPASPWTLRRKIARRLGMLKNRFYQEKPAPQNPYSYWVNELLPPSRGFIAHVLGLIEQHHIDIVQCEMLRNLALVHSLPPTVKTLFIHHELGFVRHQLEARTIHDEHFDGTSYMQCSKALEVSQLSRYDAVVTLSPIDRQKLMDAGVTAPVKNTFAIINTSDFDANAAHNALTLSFIGPDNHTPNFVGLKWFLDNCWDSLLKSDPNYRLKIIGLWSQPNIDDFTTRYRNVDFTGFVPDLAAALRDTIMIVPITVGSGIRMKILEASSRGIPFVSTTIGAEGIPVVSGQHCLLADQPADFVASIQQLRDDQVRQTLVHNAYMLIKEQYSLEALRRNRLAIYTSLYE